MKQKKIFVILAAVACNNSAIPACLNAVPLQADSMELQTVLTPVGNKVQCEVILTENRFDMEENVVISGNPKVVFTGIADQSAAQHFCAYAWVNEQGKLCIDYSKSVQADGNGVFRSMASKGADYILEFHAAAGQCTDLYPFDKIGTDVSLGHSFCTYMSNLVAPSPDALIGAMVGLTAVYGQSAFSGDGEIGATDYLDSHITTIALEPCCAELPFNTEDYADEPSDGRLKQSKASSTSKLAS